MSTMTLNGLGSKLTKSVTLFSSYSNDMANKNYRKLIHLSTMLCYHPLLIFLWLIASCTILNPNVAVGASESPPGFLDFENLPVTRFSCEGKVIGGYYADIETGCQMFHVCTLGQKGEVQDIKFLCLNGTVFDQETRVCERVDEVDCTKAERFYELNLDLYIPNEIEEESHEVPVTEHVPKTTPKPTTTTTVRAITSSAPSSSPYSTYNYYLRTPHSQVESGYNSQSQQSYLVNKDVNIKEKSSSGGQGRKAPNGLKTILYTSSSVSSTARPLNSYVTPKKSSTAKPPSSDEYYYEYYEDDYPQNIGRYGDVYSPYSYYDQKKGTSYEYDYNKRENKSLKDVATPTANNKIKSSAKSERNKTTPAPPPSEDYYYYDYYPEDILIKKEEVVKSLQDTIQSKIPSASIDKQSKSSNNNNLRSGSDGDGKGDSLDFYNSEQEHDVNTHHFKHIDVPRIPYAKPNVPRVLVTNGKPFLPRLRRQSGHHKFFEGIEDSSLTLNLSPQRSSTKQRFSDLILSTRNSPAYLKHLEKFTKGSSQ